MRRFDKALSALMQPHYWPALARGILPGLEHADAFIGRDYRCVIDVGANKGQFAAFAQARWPNARLICFEPLPGPRARLGAITRRGTEIHAVALGEADGEAEMHIASREDSSSLLPLGETQKRLFDMQEARRITVPVRRLDAVLEGETLAGPVLLKIDVQGFEFETLKGASGLLDRIDAAYVECSFVELYAGQKLAEDVAALMTKGGFAHAGKFNVCRESEQDVQADMLFERV